MKVAMTVSRDAHTGAQNKQQEAELALLACQQLLTLKKEQRSYKKKNLFLCIVEDCCSCAEAVISFSLGCSASQAATNNQSHWFPL